MTERLFHWLHRLFPYKVEHTPYGWSHYLRRCLEGSE